MLVSWLLEKLHARANTLSRVKTPKNEETTAQTEVQNLLQNRRDLAIKYIDDEHYLEAEAEYRFLIDNKLAERRDSVSLGFVLKLQNKLHEARQILESVLDYEESKADVHYMLASIYLIEGLNDLAAANFDEALRRNSQLRPAYIEYCGLLCSQNKFGLANEIVTIGLIHFPEDIEFLVQKGHICINTKKFETALECFKKVILFDSNNLDAYRGLCSASRELDLHEQALVWVDILIQKSPGDPLAFHERGKIFNSLGCYEDAIQSLNQSLKIGKDGFELCVDMGCALGGLGRLDEAMTVFSKASEFQPESVVAYINLGAIAFRLGRHHESIRLLKNAEQNILKHMPIEEIARLKALPAIQFSEGINLNHYSLVQYSMSLGYLTLGDFSKGFEAYEWRWSVDQFLPHKRKLSSQLWLGNVSLEGKSILLFAEQGLGDTLQFARYVEKAKTIGAYVLLEVQPELKRLFDNLNLANQVFSVGDEIPKVDYHCPLLSLPLAFKTTLESIPTNTFRSDLEEKLFTLGSKWKGKFIGNDLKRIGLVWSGNKKHLGDQFRSIPFEKFKEIVCNDATFYSLQKDGRFSDQEALSENKKIIDFSDEFSDFLETATFIHHLDLVIAVDTSVAHLAASMGKPVWILLPFAPDWRWFLERSNSPWYPSVTLFRQSRLGVWDDVLKDVTEHLQNFLN